MKTLIDETEIRTGIVRLADQIVQDYRDRPLTILGVLTGSIILLADLVRKIDLPLRVGLIQASSYRGRSTTPGPLMLNAGLLPDIAERDVLLVDDIFDTGQTLAGLLQEIRERRPHSVRVAVLLRKAGRSVVDVEPDYVGFDIPDVFVVGYGLDYNDELRHLPYVAALDESDL